MDSINNRKLILTGLILIALSGGLFVVLNLVQNRTTIKSQAEANLVNVEIISPRANSKVLGVTQVRVIADTIILAENLTSVLQTDGSSSESLEVQALEVGKVVVTGKWDASQVSPGDHKLEVFLYDQTTTPSLVGSSSISVTVVPP